MLISRLLAKLFTFIAIFFLFWQTIYVNMIMEESVALSPYGLRPAYLHDKNYLIKNYLILIKQLIILLLNKKIHAKIPHSAKWQRPNGPQTAPQPRQQPWQESLISVIWNHCFFILLHVTEVFNNTNPTKSVVSSRALKLMVTRTMYKSKAFLKIYACRASIERLLHCVFRFFYHAVAPNLRVLCARKGISRVVCWLV